MSGADGKVTKTDVLPLTAFFDEGILWYINRVAFHPRGFALALNINDDGEVDGVQVWGDGDEPWQYSLDRGEQFTENKKFERFEALLASVRR